MFEAFECSTAVSEGACVTMREISVQGGAGGAGVPLSTRQPDHAKFVHSVIGDLQSQARAKPKAGGGRETIRLAKLVNGIS